MLPVASSSHRHPRDPSPKAEVSTSERTVSFRKSSSSSLEVQVDYESEIETTDHGAYERLVSSSEESSNSGLSSSVIDSIEYRRLSSGNESQKEDSSSHIESIPETLPYGRLSSDNNSPEDSPSHVVNIPETPPCVIKSVTFNPEILQHKVEQCNPQKQTVLRQCLEWYKILSSKVIYSWLLLPIYAVFIGYAAQAAYMGAVYSNECPFLRDGTSMFFLMGCSGFGASFFQALSLIQKRCFPKGCLSTTHMISFLFTVFYLGTFCIELHRFVTVEGSPSTVPGPNYCDAYFFGYVCWSNFSLFIITALLVIVLAPPFFMNVFIR